MRKLTLLLCALSILVNLVAQDFPKSTNGEITDYFSIQKIASVKVKNGKRSSLKWKDYSGKVRINDGWNCYIDESDTISDVIPSRALFIVIIDKKGKEHKYIQTKKAIVKIGNECNYENVDNAGKYLNCQIAIFNELQTSKKVTITNYVYKESNMFIIDYGDRRVIYKGSCKS